MSNFTVRVELYGNPSFQTYQNLHERMESAGYTRKISFEGNKTIYWLPNAEYSIAANSSPEDIKTKTLLIVKTVWTDFGILVTKTDIGRAVHNLKVVQG